jgi:hypothetical protein
MTVTVSPITGRFVADAATIERLRSLCEQDAVELRSGRGFRNAANTSRPGVEAQPSDSDIDALLGSLMVTVHGEAMKSFALARDHTVPGGLIDMRDIHIGQAARLTRAFADLVEARARRRGMVVEHRHQHLHRRVP